jgi:hypothetical protein
MLGEDAVCLEDSIIGQSNTSSKLLLGHLTGLMIGEEGREDSVADCPFRHVRSDLRHYSAHIGAGHDGGILFGGLVVLVFAIGH